MAEKKIGSRYFKAGEALATDSLRLQIKLLRVFGTAIAKLPVIFAAKQPGATDQDRIKAEAAAVEALGMITAKADPDEWIGLVEDILRFGMIAHDPKGNWDEIILDQEFSGSNGRDLIPVLIFLLQETLGDFFSGVLGNGNQVSKLKG